MQSDRRSELAGNLEQIRARIERACARAGRDPATVTLVAVTKMFPATDIELLAELGIGDIGENRDQEAKAKATACAGVAGLRWHFVGQVQTNKARSVASYADVVHSVDRPSLVRALGRGAVEQGRTVRCLLQVGLEAEPGRGGADPAVIPALADAVAAESGLTLAGVMAVPPLNTDPRAAFDRLRAIATQLYRSHPDAYWISAGMSEDFEIAIEYGATHVRVGRRLLGERATRR